MQIRPTPSPRKESAWGCVGMRGDEPMQSSYKLLKFYLSHRKAFMGICIVPTQNSPFFVPTQNVDLAKVGETGVYKSKGLHLNALV